MSSHNRRSCRSKEQGYGSSHLHSVKGGPNQEPDSHCIRPISSQGGWETDVVGFVACDGDARHVRPPQIGQAYFFSCGPGDSDRAGRAGSSDRISPWGGRGSQQLHLQWSRALNSGEAGSSPPIVPDHEMTGWSSQTHPRSREHSNDQVWRLLFGARVPDATVNVSVGPTLGCVRRCVGLSVGSLSHRGCITCL